MPAVVEERRANVLELMKLLDQCGSQFQHQRLPLVPVSVNPSLLLFIIMLLFFLGLSQSLQCNRWISRVLQCACEAQHGCVTTKQTGSK